MSRRQTRRKRRRRLRGCAAAGVGSLPRGASPGSWSRRWCCRLRGCVAAGVGSLLRRASPRSWSGRWRWWWYWRLVAVVILISYVALSWPTSIRLLLSLLRRPTSWLRVLSASLGALRMGLLQACLTSFLRRGRNAFLGIDGYPACSTVATSYLRVAFLIRHTVTKMI